MGHTKLCWGRNSPFDSSLAVSFGGNVNGLHGLSPKIRSAGESSGTPWRGKEATWGCLPAVFLAWNLRQQQQKKPKQSKKVLGQVEGGFLCWRWAGTALPSRGGPFVVACCPLCSIQAEAFLAWRRKRGLGWTSPSPSLWSVQACICRLAAQALLAAEPARV